MSGKLIMRPKRSAIFLIQLVQDVQLLRPLVFMAAREFGFDVIFLVSTRFVGRDVLGIWQNELDEIAAQAGGRVTYFESDWEARRHLRGEGLLFSASESHLHNHVTTHNLFRHAPTGFLKVTLQHGFECVGFRHSADHVRAHGATASFGADIVCAWSHADQLTSVSPSQCPKLWVTGPSSVLQLPAGGVERERDAPGIVCENLHSVRFAVGGKSKSEFVSAFAAFARIMAKRKREVVLRPHPGGQYFVKNRVELPANVRLENAPSYRFDLRQFSYGISAPSSVLIDFLLAGIPTAVWRDRREVMDADNYAGLATVSSPREWADFARKAEEDPGAFVDRQEQFLKRQDMLIEPREVFYRFAALFEAAEDMEDRRTV